MHSNAAKVVSRTILWLLELKNDEQPQLANFAFHGRNAILVKFVNVLQPTLCESPQPVVKFCVKFGEVQKVSA